MAKYCCNENFYTIEDFKEGAIVKFKELPIKSLGELGLVIDEDFKISSVLMRIDSLGNMSTVIELDKLPGRYFSPSVLMIKNLNKDLSPVNKPDERTISNLIAKNKNLSSENSYLKSIINHSLNGNF